MDFVFSILDRSLHLILVGKLGCLGAFVVLSLISACGRPDGQALKKLACEQMVNNIDLQSVSQLDALRKALGLAPGVDPIGASRSLGIEVGSGASSQGGN
jgi:hypothetical protein